MKKILFCAIFLFLFSVFTYSQNTTINGVTEEWPPYNYTADGKVSGLSTEIVKAIFEDSKIKININVYPWARAYEMAQNDENVLIYTIIKNPEREKLFKWVGPIVPPGKMYMYKLKSRKDVNVKTIEDAKKYKIGVVPNDLSHIELKKKGFEDGKNLDIVASEDVNLNKLFNNRIDLICFFEEGIPFRLKSAGHTMNDVEAVVMLMEADSGYYMAFSKKTSDDVVKKINDSFNKLKASGKIDKIRKDFLSGLK